MKLRHLKYFEDSEFRRCSPPCSLDQMDASFMITLDSARSASAVPFVLNSAFRSSDWDISKGRSGNGYHTKGRAVDIRCLDSRSRAEIVRSCLSVGLSCGISKTFVHVDDRPGQIVFLY